MDEGFISEGLENNRYLKAYQLVTLFESQVADEIEEMCRSVRDSHPDLFKPDASLTTRDYDTRTLRTLRTEANMKMKDEEGHNLTINIGLEWEEASEQPYSEATVGTDTLCYVQYKIKFGSERTFEAVKEETRDEDRWKDLRFGEEKWDSPPKVAPGIVYRPVEASTDISDGLALLEDHFSTVYASHLTSA